MAAAVEMAFTGLCGSTRALCSGLLLLLVTLWSLKIETGAAESGCLPRREPGRSSDNGIFASGTRGSVVPAGCLVSSCLSGGCNLVAIASDAVAAAGREADIWLLSSNRTFVGWLALLLLCLLSAAWMRSMRCWLVLECFAPAEADFGRSDVGFEGTNAATGVAVGGPFACKDTCEPYHKMEPGRHRMYAYLVLARLSWRGRPGARHAQPLTQLTIPFACELFQSNHYNMQDHRRSTLSVDSWLDSFVTRASSSSGVCGPEEASGIRAAWVPLLVVPAVRSRRLGARPNCSCSRI